MLHTFYYSFGCILRECSGILLYVFFCQIFPRRERNFTSEAICSWVFEHHETVLHWLQPPGTKSRLLEHELTKGPALLLFLPHNPLGSKPSPILQQVSRVGEKNHIEGERKFALTDGENFWSVFTLKNKRIIISEKFLVQHICITQPYQKFKYPTLSPGYMSCRFV